MFSPQCRQCNSEIRGLLCNETSFAYCNALSLLYFSCRESSTPVDFDELVMSSSAMTTRRHVSEAVNETLFVIAYSISITTVYG